MAEGTSIQPLMAETLCEFVPVEDFLKVVEAALRVFNRTAWLRRNKMKARIKVLVHAEGIESFRQQVEEELKEDWAQDYESRDELLFFDEEADDAPRASREQERDWERRSGVPRVENDQRGPSDSDRLQFC